MVRATEKLVVGGKRDPLTDVGPLVTEAEAARVVRWIDEAVAGGAVLHTGGRRTGPFVTPAALTDVPADARLRLAEVFGPVVLLDPFVEVEDAPVAANASTRACRACSRATSTRRSAGRAWSRRSRR